MNALLREPTARAVQVLLATSLVLLASCAGPLNQHPLAEASTPRVDYSAGRVNLTYLVVSGFIANLSIRDIGDTRTFNVKLVSIYNYVIRVEVEGNKVLVVVRPPSFEEFRGVLLAWFKRTIFVPPKGVNMSIEEFNEYVRRQVEENNVTFIRMWYEDFINNTIKHNITVRQTYILDENNYVVNFPELGFFPLYSVYEVTYEDLKDRKLVYLGIPLDVLFGARSTSFSYYNLTVLEPAEEVVLRVKGLELTPRMYFYWNYSCCLREVLLPVNETHTLILLNVEPHLWTEKFLQSLPPYRLDLGPTLADRLLVAGIIAAPFASAAAVALWYRRKRG